MDDAADILHLGLFWAFCSSAAIPRLMFCREGSGGGVMRDDAADSVLQLGLLWASCSSAGML